MLTVGQNLSVDKARAVEEVGRRVTAARARHVTLIPGQEGTYVEKKAQALRWIATSVNGPPEVADPGAFRFIFREVGTTGENPDQVAQVIANLANAWGIVGPDIEGARVDANAAIRASTNRAEIAACLDALDDDLDDAHANLAAILAGLD